MKMEGGKKALELFTLIDIGWENKEFSKINHFSVIRFLSTLYSIGIYSCIMEGELILIIIA